jgi:phage FluMu protein Com
MEEKLRCLSCGKVLLIVEVFDGAIEKICPRCKTQNRWEFKRQFVVENGEIHIKLSKIFSKALDKKEQGVDNKSTIK